MDTEDYISLKLPEPILQKILSLLDIKEAFRASTVSRTWSNACKALPELNFDLDFFYMKDSPRGFVNDRRAKAKLDLVDAILSRQIIKNKAGVEKFWLILPYNSKYLDFDVGHYFERFIKLLIQVNIRELVLEDLGGGLENIPECLYYSKSLTVLTLSLFTLKMPECGGAFKLSELKELKLVSCTVENEVIELFLSSCKELVSLCLSYCSFDVINIGSFLLKLRRFRLKSMNIKKVEIKAPNIQILEIFGVKCLNLLDIVACKNLTVLNLNKFAFSDSTLNVVDISLPMLETAFLLDGCGVKKLRVSGNRLKILNLKNLDGITEVDVDAPNLITFIWLGVYLFSLSMSGAMRLEELFFETYQSPNPEGEINPNYLIDLLSKFSHAKDVTLRFGNRLAKTITPEKLKDISLPPLYNAKELSFKFTNEDANPRYFHVVLGLLWIAPILDVLTLTRYDNIGNAQLQFIYQDDYQSVQQARGLDPKCSGCRLLQFKCCCHPLRKVEIWNFEIFGIREELVDHFTTHFERHSGRPSMTCVDGSITVVADALHFYCLDG